MSKKLIKWMDSLWYYLDPLLWVSPLDPHSLIARRNPVTPERRQRSYSSFVLPLISMPQLTCWRAQPWRSCTTTTTAAKHLARSFSSHRWKQHKKHETITNENRWKAIYMEGLLHHARLEARCQMRFIGLKGIQHPVGTRRKNIIISPNDVLWRYNDIIASCARWAGVFKPSAARSRPSRHQQMGPREQITRRLTSPSTV